MAGRNVYSKYLTSVTDTDILAQIRTTLGRSDLLFTKMSLVSDSSFTYDVNSLGVFSDPYLDALDSKYKISVDADEVLIVSAVIHENALSIWVAVQF